MYRRSCREELGGGYYGVRVLFSVYRLLYNYCYYAYGLIENIFYMSEVEKLKFVLLVYNCFGIFRDFSFLFECKI